jgi:uncharacterized repeat protein (TIGR03803 family)
MVLVLIALMLPLVSLPIVGQTYDAIYNFSGGSDSGNPQYGVTIDANGNLWGTTTQTVFQISHRGFSTIYKFPLNPSGPQDVLLDPSGRIWSSTYYGGDRNCDPDGCGTLFNLRPYLTASPTTNHYWKESTVYTFHGSAQGDGSVPNPGMIMDNAGNIFGTTQSGGGACNCGTVFELSPVGQSWTLTTLYAFTGGNDGSGPLSGVVAIGNKLYGTTQFGGSGGHGVAYELMFNGAAWVETPIYALHGSDEGEFPSGGLTVDPDGNLYGTTLGGGTGGGGTVFKLTNNAGVWSFQLVSPLTGVGGPTGNLALDSQGNIYGSTEADGAFGGGSVFELVPSGQSWTYRTLHDFCLSGCGGFAPLGKVSLDSAGNIFGTTVDGGTGCAPIGCGVVWEITR